MTSQGCETLQQQRAEVQANSYNKNKMTKRNFIPQTQFDCRKLQAYQKGGSVFVYLPSNPFRPDLFPWTISRILKKVTYISEKGTAQFWIKIDSSNIAISDFKKHLFCFISRRDVKSLKEPTWDVLEQEESRRGTSRVICIISRFWQN